MGNQLYYASILLAIKVELRKQFLAKNKNEISRLQKVFWQTQKALEYEIGLSQAQKILSESLENNDSQNKDTNNSNSNNQ